MLVGFRREAHSLGVLMVIGWCLYGALREIRPNLKGMWLEETSWNALALL